MKVLSNRFFDAMTKCNILGLECKLGTSSALDTYLNAYECLFNGEVEIAVSLLADTRICVDKMEKKVDELVTTFDELTAYTNKVLQEVIEESNADGAKQNEMKVIVMDLKDSAKEIENLSSDKEINTMIELQRDKELEQNAAYFKKILFVRGYAEILARWKALEVVFTEYRTAIIRMDN